MLREKENYKYLEILEADAIKQAMIKERLVKNQELQMNKEISRD